MEGHFFRTTDDIIRYLAQDPKDLKHFLKSNSSEGNSDYIHIKEAAQGINFLLNENIKFGPYPLGYLVTSRNKLKGATTYSNLSYNSVQVVKDISDRLNMVKKSTLKEKFEPQRFADEAVLPEGRWSEDDALDVLLEQFRKLKKFYKMCSDTGSAIVMYTSIPKVKVAAPKSDVVPE